MKKLLLALASFFVIAQISQAHPTGHKGNASENASHFLTDPSHSLVIVGLAGLVSLSIFIKSSQRKRALARQK